MAIFVYTGERSTYRRLFAGFRGTSEDTPILEGDAFRVPGQDDGTTLTNPFGSYWVRVDDPRERPVPTDLKGLISETRYLIKWAKESPVSFDVGWDNWINRDGQIEWIKDAVPHARRSWKHRLLVSCDQVCVQRFEVLSEVAANLGRPGCFNFESFDEEAVMKMIKDLLNWARSQAKQPVS